MSEPICREDRLDINEREWAPECGQAATTRYNDRFVCREHREHFERQEIETIAETFFDGVPLEELRKIAALGGLKPTLDSLAKLLSFLQDVPGDRLAEIDAAGGLKALLASHACLVAACEVGLPHLAQAHVPRRDFAEVSTARHEALPFLSKDRT